MIEYEVIDFVQRRASDAEAEALHVEKGDKVFALDRLRLVDGRKMSLECRVIPDELGRRMTHEMLGTKSIYQILDREFRLRVLRVEGTIRAALASPKIAERLDAMREPTPREFFFICPPLRC